MARGNFEGHTAADAEVRKLFTRESLLDSDWYRERLESRLRFDVAARERLVAHLERFIANPIYHSEAERLGLQARLQSAQSGLADARKRTPQELVGMIGRDPALD